MQGSRGAAVQRCGRGPGGGARGSQRGHGQGPSSRPTPGGGAQVAAPSLCCLASEDAAGVSDPLIHLFGGLNARPRRPGCTRGPGGGNRRTQPASGRAPSSHGRRVPRPEAGSRRLCLPNPRAFTPLLGELPFGAGGEASLELGRRSHGAPGAAGRGPGVARGRSAHAARTACTPQAWRAFPRCPVLFVCLSPL